MAITSTADLLDRCITAFLAGQDWRAHIPPAHPAAAEIAELMDIVREIRGARPASPAAAPPRRAP